jgi:hypothetical protein
MAGDAVVIAPVSRSISLLTGNFTGKISILATRRHEPPPKKFSTYQAKSFWLSMGGRPFAAWKAESSGPA